MPLASAQREMPHDSGLAARFIPAPDIVERHAVTVHAPSALVFEVARHFDLQSIRVVRSIFRLRSLLLRSRKAEWDRSDGLVEETRRMGWGTLQDEPGRAYVAGALAQPWKANVKFIAVPADRFKTEALADHVKIVWTIETERVEPDVTCLASETRVTAVDDSARAHFRRYWRIFGTGIVLIRWFLLPAVRREAERRYQLRRRRVVE